MTRRFWWLRIAPFGLPVVPLVYCKTAVSDAAGSEGHGAGDIDGDDAGDTHRRGKTDDAGRDLVPDDGRCSTVILKLMQQLAVGVERVVLHHDSPDPEHGIEGDHVLGAVREHDGHPVVAAYALGVEKGQCVGHQAAQALEIEGAAAGR